MMYNESYDISEVLDRNMYNNYIIYSIDFLLYILYGCYSLKKKWIGLKNNKYMYGYYNYLYFDMVILFWGFL